MFKTAALLALLILPSVALADTTVTVFWTNATGATEYNVFRIDSTKHGIEFTRLHTAKETGQPSYSFSFVVADHEATCVVVNACNDDGCSQMQSAGALNLEGIPQGEYNMCVHINEIPQFTGAGVSPLSCSPSCN